MTARFSTAAHSSSYCGNSAAAGTSVRALAIMDTVILAVSILIVCLLPLVRLQ